ncbi:tol-pal system protein YbgF [Endozoicomonas euniceicola]|uniref:Cell division coordinator CpoB n=1 Tax=Endozoicomonas euniceicola TaxID=1234143 RepID=A0ABY6GWK3_9GAMM|nr:tol-pal system protein YbgF [Endozoicomonas euniceicola]UYM16779.1 tol-pal system protein YbgF [Endozoicomonas euniceicola]
MSLKPLSSSSLIMASLLAVPVLAEVPVVESLPTAEIVSETTQDVTPVSAPESVALENVAPENVESVIQSAQAQQPANSTAYFLNQIEELRKRNMTLEGRVEELEFQLRQNEAEFRDRYLDLDARITKAIGEQPASDLNKDHSAKTTQAVEPVNVPAQLPDSKTPEELLVKQREQADYKAAFGFIREREFDQALVALRKLLEDYPDGKLSDNAQYWLGEVLMAQGKFEPARDEFRAVIEQYPQSAKVPDASYKLGRLYDLLGDKAKARKYLELVVSKYPDSSAARLSDTYLQSMSDS